MGKKKIASSAKLTTSCYTTNQFVNETLKLSVV